MAGSRRTPSRAQRRRLEVRGVANSEAAVEVRAPALAWPLAVVAAGLVSVLAGWLVVVAPVLLATVTGSSGSVSSALSLATGLWLLGHGAGTVIGTTTITLVPLGLTLVLVLILSGLSGAAARQAVLAQESDDLSLETQHRLLVRLVLGFTGTYVVAVGIVAFLATTPVQVAKALVASAVLAGLSSLLGVSRVVGWRPTRLWPVWARRVPLAVGGGVTTVVLGGTLALGTALYQGRHRIVELTASLGADPAGGVVLLLGQLAYLPNLVLWGASWVLGAGFTLGDSSVVSPTATQVGLLPAVPVLGAVPGGSSGRWVLVCWLLVGVVAGVVAAWVAVAPRRRARFDETALVGGLAGVVAGVALTVCALLSRGNLGVGRLVGIGPRPVELLVMACSLLGISGMAAGLVVGLVSRGGRGADASSNVGVDDETAPLQ